MRMVLFPPDIVGTEKECQGMSIIFTSILKRQFQFLSFNYESISSDQFLL